MMKKDNTVRAEMNKGQFRWYMTVVVLAIILLLSVAAMLMFGNTNYNLFDVVKVLGGQQIKGASFAVVTIRLPKMLAGMAAGMAFGLAGSTFQTLLRNPLASPDIIGITAGSSTAAVFAILVLGISGMWVSVIAVFCGVLTAGLIYMLSSRKDFSGGKLILIGIGVQSMLSAANGYLLVSANQYDVPGAMRWLSGSLNTIRLSEITGLLSVLMCAGPLILFFGRYLQILELGEHSAIALGIQINRVRIILIICAVLLIAFSVSVTGPIAFVAFIAGPFAKKISGTSKHHGLPSALVGGVLVLVAELIGQFAFRVKMPVGVITGVLGAPYLLVLLIQQNRSGGQL